MWRTKGNKIIRKLKIDENNEEFCYVKETSAVIKDCRINYP